MKIAIFFRPRVFITTLCCLCDCSCSTAPRSFENMSQTKKAHTLIAVVFNFSAQFNCRYSRFVVLRLPSFTAQTTDRLACVPPSVRPQLQLEAMLDLIESPGLWTPWGLRSLSSADPSFGQDENYWRGNIWINMNFLAGRLALDPPLPLRPFGSSVRLLCAGLFSSLGRFFDFPRLLESVLCPNLSIPAILWTWGKRWTLKTSN